MSPVIQELLDTGADIPPPVITTVKAYLLKLGHLPENKIAVFWDEEDQEADIQWRDKSGFMSFICIRSDGTTRKMDKLVGNTIVPITL
jgi:hypothetical protein